MHSTSFLTFFGLAVAAFASPTPQIPASETSNPIQPLEVFNLWVTAKNAVHFFVTDLNTNTTATCETENLEPYQLYACDNNARFIFNEDNSALGIEWTWSDSHQGNGTVDVSRDKWTCFNGTAQFEAGCAIDILEIPLEVVF